jgi:4-amino-4-deoxychorismate lyase
MSLFFETIRFQDGEFSLLDYHEERLNRTRREVFNATVPLRISNYLEDTPEGNGLFRCRIIYGKQVESVCFESYSLAIHRKVGFHEDPGMDYSYKYLERLSLTEAVKGSSADDVIILKNGFLTDASYSNLALFDGTNWVTPETHLLAGVKRAYLVDQGYLKIRKIKRGDLSNYSRIAFINAMRDFELVYTFEITDNYLILSLLE